MTLDAVGGRDPATGRPLRVRIAAGRIAAVERLADADAPGADGAYLAPGLVDLQVNGYAGHDLNADGLTPDTVAALARAVWRTGTTTFVPTLITAAEAAMAARAVAVAEARRRDPRLAWSIPFIHLEGPHLAPEDGPRGAHPSAHIRPPDLAEFDRLQAACDNLVGMVTLSPHYPDAPGHVRGLVARGVRVAIGHTGATPDRVAAAVDAGAVLSTHLGNGAAAMLPRHPNFIWTQLADDRLTATFIADGHHLPDDALKAMIRAKGLGRTVLVSDVAAPGGLPPGTYRQPIGGAVELSADGRLAMAGTPYLAGAALPLAAGVAIAARAAGLPLAEALALATVNPGRFAGGRGVLEAGASADLVRFAWRPGADRLLVESAFVAGERVS